MRADPIAVVKDVLDRLNAENWLGVAELCDEGSLSFFRRNLLWRITERGERQLEKQDDLRLTPDLPPEVAEYHAQQHRKFSDPLARLREELPEVASIEELQRLSPKELFAHWLRGHSPRRQLDRLVELGQVSRARADKAMPSTISMWSYTLLGTVMDGDRVAHVLYRSELSPDAWSYEERQLRKSGAPEFEIEFHRDTFDRESASVVTCRRDSDGTWRLLAGDHLFSFGLTLIGMSDDDGDVGIPNGSSD